METTAEQLTRKPLSTWLLLASLYMTQYLGLGFFWIALVAIMRRQGMPLEQLGVIYLLGLFWVIKVLWAPLIDRYGFGRLGHYRGWMLLTQGGMVLCLVVIGMVMNILGSVLSVLASLFTGWLLRQWTRFSVLIGTAIAQVIGLLALTLPLIGPPDEWRIHCSVGAYFLVHVALSTLMSTMMMDRVSLKSPATDFTLQFSIYSLMMFIAAAGSTALAGHLGYLAVVMVACVFACLALVLALYFKPPAEKGMDRVALGDVYDWF